MNNTFKLTEKQSLSIYKKVQKYVSYEGYKIPSIENEDLVQELWIELVETANKRKRYEPKILSGLLKWKFIDILRLEIKKDHLSLDFLDNMSEVSGRKLNEDGSKKNYEYEIVLNSAYYKKIKEVEKIIDLNNLFEEGSKEQELLDIHLKLSKINILASNIVLEKETQDYIAQALGYKNANSKSYYNKRYKVKKAVKEYLCS